MGHRLGPENIGQVIIDGEQITALIDNGARINVVTPSYAKRHGLVVGSIKDLNKHHRRIPVSCSEVITPSPLDMSCFGYNSPESLPMTRIRWLWSSEIRVSSAGE